MTEVLSDIGSLFEMLFGGMSVLVDYITSGVDYILDLMLYIPIEISTFMSAVLTLSIILFYLGRSENH